MHNDIFIAGEHTNEELKSLHGKEHNVFPTHNSRAVTIVKALTMLTGMILAIFSAMLLPLDLTFISITFIAVIVTAFVIGAEKIVAIFPRGI